MLRTLGFLTGVGITIAGLLVVLEPAELQRLQAETTSRLARLLPEQTDAARRWGQWGRNALPGGGASPPGESPLALPRVQEAKADAEQRPVDGQGPAPEAGSPRPSEPQSPGEIAPGPLEAGSRPTSTEPPRSHLFWDPFRSEPAARGFADRLSTATDVTVMVTEEGPANYRVGFSYRDDAERRALIERIETVTGLELE